MTQKDIWWKDATVYQIWPASYKDSNGDGVGDIPGIISTLDYVKNLGIDVIWLSPAYDSPQDDMGYDISDYESVYPKYGTMEDMDQLIDECHKRGMRLILDLVINHTSSEHQWFKESRSSKTSPKRDWYIWQPAKYDEAGNRHPPNNWSSHFSESVWEWDEGSQEYYLHFFAKTQPDLNWENEETRQAIYKSALTFWFEKGIDGFRIDTAGMYSKRPTFEDAPIVFPDRDIQPAGYYTDTGPRIHEFHKEMFSQVTSKYDVMTVGEVGHCSLEDKLKYVSAKEGEMNMMFLFDLVDNDSGENDKFNYLGFDLLRFKNAVTNMCSFIKGTDAWSTVFIENHDQARSISRFGNPSPEWRVKSGKLLASMLITLTGTLFIYQGQEIGMINIPLEWDLSEYLDICTINYLAKFAAGKTEEEMKTLKRNINMVARDNGRTPVQWDSSENGGFTTGKPWMRVIENYDEINVASQVDDPDSLYNFYKNALAIRKNLKNAFIYGDLEILDFDNEQVFSYVKTGTELTAYVVLNFTDKEVEFKKLVDGELDLVLTNHSKLIEGVLSPYEARVYTVSK